MHKNAFRSHSVCSHPYIYCKHLTSFVFSPYTVWVFSFDSKASKFSTHKDTKTSACLAVHLSRFALVFSLIFASCCAGSGLFKYDGSSDWTFGMNPWNMYTNCYDYWNFALLLFYTYVSCEMKKKYSEQHFAIFFWHSAFLMRWSVEFIRLYR